MTDMQRVTLEALATAKTATPAQLATMKGLRGVPAASLRYDLSALVFYGYAEQVDNKGTHRINFVGRAYLKGGR